MGEAPLAPLGFGDLVKLALAVKAAVGRVGDVSGALDLVRFDELLARADLPGDRLRCFFFEGREAWGHRRHADHARPEYAVGDGEHESAVDPARVANENGPE